MKGVLKHCKSAFEATDGEDYVTQDLCVRLLADDKTPFCCFEAFRKNMPPTLVSSLDRDGSSSDKL